MAVPNQGSFANHAEPLPIAVYMGYERRDMK